MNKYRTNQQIRVPSVRVIDAESKPLGILPTREALRLATDAGLDLVEVQATSQPPVCRIMDFGKFKYEAKKRAVQHSAPAPIKEVQFGVRIAQNDFETKVRHVRRFLGEGSQVRVVITFRGREIVHPEIGREVLARLMTEMDSDTKAELYRIEGKKLSTVLRRAQP